MPDNADNERLKLMLYGEQKSKRNKLVLAKRFFDGYFQSYGWKSVEEVEEHQLNGLDFTSCVLCIESFSYTAFE